MGGSARDDLGAMAVGSVLAAALDPVGEAERRERIIRQTVRYACPKVHRLQPGPARQWGAAIADGRIAHSKLTDILLRIEARRKAETLPRDEEFFYFLGASRTAFRESGLEWKQAKKGR